MSAEKSSADIPGWFQWVDQLLFKAVLGGQRDLPSSSVVELGTYLGKSAVLIGDYLRPGEEFVALDLFGRTDLIEESGAANRREVNISYKTLTRSKFEENYLSRHPTLPTIVESASSAIVEHVEPGSVRFLHVDASHMYEHVRTDARNARLLLRPGGVVVFDDWRSEHTPGVTAAVWQSVYEDGLIPVVLTPAKFYGVFSEPELLRESAELMVGSREDLWSENQQIAGNDVLRVRVKQTRKPPATAPIDQAQLEALMAKMLDTRWKRWSKQISSVVAREAREAAVEASTITRVRRFLRRRR